MSGTKYQNRYIWMVIAPPSLGVIDLWPRQKRFFVEVFNLWKCGGSNRKKIIATLYFSTLFWGLKMENWENGWRSYWTLLFSSTVRIFWCQPFWRTALRSPANALLKKLLGLKRRMRFYCRLLFSSTARIFVGANHFDVRRCFRLQIDVAKLVYN